MANSAFVFFNCDGAKSEASMNIFYNSTIYGNSSSARRRLWNKIQEELKAGRVKIAEQNVKKVEKLILDGNYLAASDFIQYGAIREFEYI